MANLGLAVVFVAVPWLYIGFKAVGAGYLAWQVLKPGGRGLFEPQRLERDPAGSCSGGSADESAHSQGRDPVPGPDSAVHRSGASANPTAQGFALGGVQIVVSLLVNALIVLAARSVAGLIARRPSFAVWQRRITGTLLGGVALLLAREVPARARI
ncbi:hypothetical protein [Amycolatopsis sulphurea]|uniref:hypothetical protein n=1 Tax=Amycolatopsis sulphurea TaxID=76022 RepID=UPI001FE2677E|nr:hypothetical protein [Amycolatopsis sulphurea]